jgi:hypothetical protein
LARPIYKTAQQNGLPIVRFNSSGVVDFLTLDTPISLTPFTMFAVVKPSNVGSIYSIWAGLTGSPQWRLTSQTQELLKQSIASIGSASSTISTSSFTAIAVTYSNPTYRFYKQSSSDGTGSNAQTFTDSVYYLGAAFGTIEAFDGDIGETLIYNRLLSSDEVLSRLNDLNNRWDL